MTNHEILEALKQLAGPLLICMVGPPGCGKSTLSGQIPGVILSMETKVDPRYKCTKAEYLQKQFSQAYMQNKTIIVDRICMTRKARATQLTRPLVGYKLVAVNLHNVAIPDLITRMSTRPDLYRHIPEHVLTKIFEEYEPPSVDEGFEVILTRTGL